MVMTSQLALEKTAQHIRRQNDVNQAQGHSQREQTSPLPVVLKFTSKEKDLLRVTHLPEDLQGRVPEFCTKENQILL